MKIREKFEEKKAASVAKRMTTRSTVAQEFASWRCSQMKFDESCLTGRLMYKTDEECDGEYDDDEFILDEEYNEDDELL